MISTATGGLCPAVACVLDPAAAAAAADVLRHLALQHHALSPCLVQGRCESMQLHVEKHRVVAGEVSVELAVVVVVVVLAGLIVVNNVVSTVVAVQEGSQCLV